MRWLGNNKPKDIWEEQIVPPVGDIEAADLIRRICRTAVGAESSRYQRAAKCAMEIAMKIKDDLMRDVAVGEIVDLCLGANDVKKAQILFRAIQTDAIIEKVRNAHPALRG